MNSTRFAMRRRMLRMFGAGIGGAAWWPQLVAAQAGSSDYRALVCVLLGGGNDGENTLIRHDTAGYAQYAATRTPASGLNVAQSRLLPIQPEGQSSVFGLHPACAPLQTLFNQKKLALVANVGTLLQPTTRAGLLAKTDPLPSQLFSHSDQIRQVQTADATDLIQSGWGGRLADRMGIFNGSNVFPPLMSLAAKQPFATGNTSIPLTLPYGNEFAVMPAGDGSMTQITGLRDAAMLQMLEESRGNRYEQVAQSLAREGLKSSSTINPILRNPSSPVAALFNGLGGDAARGLRQAARLIESRASTGLKRQIFLVYDGGYDTHYNQLGDHDLLLGNLSKSLRAFSDSMALLGLERNVTTFTLTDFGRTFKPAANGGTDHGWGTLAMVMGGSVQGGRIHGTLPTLALGGPDDQGDDGRWIPTTSYEQYGATLARWFGVDASTLNYAFPFLANFPQSDVGFMHPV